MRKATGNRQQAAGLRIGERVKVFVPGNNGGLGTIRDLRITNMGVEAVVEADAEGGSNKTLIDQVNRQEKSPCFVKVV